jgi:hypothetical protein
MPPDRALIAVEIPSIQRYVFSSDVLRELVGGSQLVRDVTETWPAELCAELNRAPSSPPSSPQAEVLLSGGGRQLVLLNANQDLLEAKTFVGALSERIAVEAPGLPVIVSIQPLDWGSPGALSLAVKAADECLRRKKLTHGPANGLGSLPVSVRCTSTGDAAAGTVTDRRSEPPRPVSGPVLAKHLAVKRANDRLRRILDRPPAAMDFPLDFDYLGRTRGVASYVAVIHADGNRMGRTISELLSPFEQAPNDAFKQAYSTLSKSIDDAGVNALRTVTEELIRCSTSGRFAGEFDLPRLDLDGEMLALPMRPIVYGGDDTTLVCDGRIALALAERYLRAFGTQEITNGDTTRSIAARAGIAIVKAHYPFSHAYELADDLAMSAKTHGPAAALDWHLAATGVLGELDDLRQRGYTAETGESLVQRPLPLEPGNDHESWTDVRALIAALQSDDWNEQRSFRHAIFESLRAGPKATGDLLRRRRSGNGWGAELPRIAALSAPDQDAGAKTGWSKAEDRCLYFDALELCDLFVNW